jgi:DNA-nicking Smr family endonuclease
LGIEVEPPGQVNRSGSHLDPFSRNQPRHNPTTLPHTTTTLDVGSSRDRQPSCRPGAVKLKLDLHDIYNRGEDIDRALRSIIDEAVEKKARLVEIIPGKGSGQLKKRVLRFLDQKEIKAIYDRVEKDSHNFGRVFVHFRWK